MVHLLLSFNCSGKICQILPVTNTLFLHVDFAVFSCCCYYMILCYAHLIVPVLIEYINNRRTFFLH